MGDNDAREYCQAKESERRLNNIDQSLKDCGSRIGELETRTVLYNEQIKTISNVLQEIKLSLKELQRTVDELEKRPVYLTQKIFIGVATSIITALLMLALKYLN